jgi:hypothetical protein
MHGGEQPGAGAERDDPAAEDKEAPPPVGPVIPQVPRLVAGCAAALFVAVHIHPPHAESMQLVTLGTQEPRRAQPDWKTASGLRRESETAVWQRVDQAVGHQAVQGTGALNGVWPHRVQAGLCDRLTRVPEDR